MASYIDTEHFPDCISLKKFLRRSHCWHWLKKFDEMVMTRLEIKWWCVSRFWVVIEERNWNVRPVHCIQGCICCVNTIKKKRNICRYWVQYWVSNTYWKKKKYMNKKNSLIASHHPWMFYPSLVSGHVFWSVFLLWYLKQSLLSYVMKW